MTDLVPNQIIIGAHAYEQALDLVLSEAQKTVYIFEQDLSQGAYNSLTRAEILRNFLAKSGRLTLIVQDADFFLKHCPRLNVLAQTYGHTMQVKVTEDHVKHLKDVFVIADESAYLRRFHIDHTRFKFSLDDIETVNVLKIRFDELLASTTHTVSVSALGL